MADYENKMLQHLGLVAGMCNEVDLANLIDECIPKANRTVSIGQAVQAMVLNALGFSERALYLNTRFYENRPVDVLIGEGVTANQLNDSCLGTALDCLYDYGVTELFFFVASKILKQQGILTRFAHLDSMSIIVRTLMFRKMLSV